MGALLSIFTPLLSFLVHPVVHFAPKPVSISVKTSKQSKEIETVSLKSFVESRCASLYRPFRPAWWLFNGHLQTAYCVVGDFSKIDKVEYDRVLLRTLDGGTLGLDFTPPANEQVLDDDTPIVVVLHGLTGGSHEAYVRAILAPACTPVEQGGLGYRGVVVNFRGCAGVPITSPQLYSAGHTDDTRVAIMYIAKRYPRARLMGVGFSLGANVLTRYLGEEGERSRLISGCALACPWDLLKNSHRLNDHWFNRMVYAKAMGQNLLNLTLHHEASLLKFGDHPVAQATRKTVALKSPLLIDFDNAMTRIAGGSSPPFPFATADDYYVWASSHTALPKVRVPFLAISSADDPIVAELPSSLDENEWVAFAITKGGGHLGWFEPAGGFGKVRRWVSRPVLEWLRAIGDDFIPERRNTPPLHEVDGFIKEVGRDDIGCKEIEGGGHIVGVEGEEGLFAGL